MLLNAVEYRKQVVVEELLKIGADPNLRNEKVQNTYYYNAATF